MFYVTKSSAEKVFDEECEVSDYYWKLENVEDKGKLFQSDNIEEVREYLEPRLSESDLDCSAFYLCNENNYVVEVFPRHKSHDAERSGLFALPDFLVGILYILLLNSILMFFSEVRHINPFTLIAIMVSLYCVVVLLKIQNVIEGALICTILSILLWIILHKYAVYQ
jgi:hypothetical protein